VTIAAIATKVTAAGTVTAEVNADAASHN
jgi:hypothetical protein